MQKLFGHPVQDTLPAHRRSFAPEWQRSSIDAESASTHTSETSQASYNQHAYPLSDLRVGNHVAVQNPTSKMWDIYGTITAIGPHRRYSIRTQSGRILIRNRRFIRKRSSWSIAGPPPSHSLLHNPSEPRRSSRTSHAPLRLSEDPTWIFSSSADTSKLGGEV